MENTKLTIKVFSLAFCATLYVAIWVWFIITGCDDSSYRDWTKYYRTFFLWVMLHVVFLIELILWAWS